MSEEEKLTEKLESLGNKRFNFIRSYLFTRANNYAPNIKALFLHQACNHLIPVIAELDPKLSHNERTEEEKLLKDFFDSLGDKVFTYIRSYLFTSANNYAPNIKALFLHQTCNVLIDVVKELDPTYFEH